MYIIKGNVCAKLQWLEVGYNPIKNEENHNDSLIKSKNMY